MRVVSAQLWWSAHRKYALGLWVAIVGEQPALDVVLLLEATLERGVGVRQSRSAVRLRRSFPSCHIFFRTENIGGDEDECTRRYRGEQPFLFFAVRRRSAFQASTKLKEVAHYSSSCCLITSGVVRMSGVTSSVVTSATVHTPM